MSTEARQNVISVGCEADGFYNPKNLAAAYLALEARCASLEGALKLGP
jgi:hypothetical protein